jgi:hypothetical protein
MVVLVSVVTICLRVTHAVASCAATSHKIMTVYHLFVRETKYQLLSHSFLCSRSFYLLAATLPFLIS